MREAFSKIVRRVKSHRLVLAVILVFRLRPINVVRVALYRRRLKSGFFVRSLPVASGDGTKDFWTRPTERSAAPQISDTLRQAILARADEVVSGVFRRFEDLPVHEGERPAWFKQGYEGTPGQHFSAVEINKAHGEDVKLCWDLSRFKWLTHLVVAAVHAPSQEEAEKYLARAQQLLRFWVADNGYFGGVNWACAQEVSIRGLHLMNGLLLLNQHFAVRPEPAAVEFLKASYQRVEATIDYSLAQDNNHSLTESLFLYYTPFFLSHLGCSTLTAKDGPRKRHARFLDVFTRLVQKDGSYRMYSLNYHRVVCDILALAKVLDDALSVKFWTPDLLERVQGMHAFLSAVIVPESQSVPVIGHNDGSLHAIQYAPYLSYTPSLLFMGSVFSLPVDQQYAAVRDEVYCFGRTVLFEAPKMPSSPLQCFDDFGLIVVRQAGYHAFLKYARNKGRPSQQDFLHFDLWVGGQNVLHDSGTYSYNPEDPALIDYFDDPSAHNGPCLKGRGFVRRMSRFLFLEWPDAKVVHRTSATQTYVSMRVENCHGETLTRQVRFSPDSIVINDAGPADADWEVTFNTPMPLDAASPVLSVALLPGVTLDSEQPMALATALYSKCYLDKLHGTRLIAEGTTPEVVTRIRIQAQA